MPIRALLGRESLARPTASGAARTYFSTAHNLPGTSTRRRTRRLRPPAARRVSRRASALVGTEKSAKRFACLADLYRCAGPLGRREAAPTLGFGNKEGVGMTWKDGRKLVSLGAIVLTAVACVAPATAGAALKYPDLRTLAPAEIHLGVALVNERNHYVVRFSNVVWNAGQGPFELHGTPHFPYDGLFDASQWIYDDPAGVDMKPVGTFAYHAAHEHFH